MFTGNMFKLCKYELPVAWNNMQGWGWGWGVGGEGGGGVGVGVCVCVCGGGGGGGGVLYGYTQSLCILFDYRLVH